MVKGSLEKLLATCSSKCVVPWLFLLLFVVPWQQFPGSGAGAGTVRARGNWVVDKSAGHFEVLLVELLHRYTTV